MRHLILVILSSYPDGSRRRRDVLDDMDEAFHLHWSTEDKQAPESTDSTTNWRVTASRERQHMVTDGLLLANDEYGQWTLTDEGRAAAALAVRDSIAAQTRTLGKSLTELSDPAALQAAINEFDQLGRDAFLAKYGQQKSRDYFIRVNDNLYDSKPILSVAHRYQYPHMGGLPVTAFSGGTGGAIRAIKRLGYEMVTPAQLHPPALGDTYPSRTDIYEQFGGDKVSGIIRFPGEDTVNAFSDASGPYEDDAPSLTEPFGYRGEGLSGPQRLDRGGNALLERARIEQVPVRFWHRPKGNEFAFVTWVFVVGRAWVQGTGEDHLIRPELEWQLLPVASDNPEPDDAQNAWDTTAELETTPPPEAGPAPTYQQLIDRIDAKGQGKTPATLKPRTDYQRSAAARRAVLLRSDGKCESLRCTGMPGEPNRRGQPILDVDHIKDLGLGGDDHPANMIALCPNCHACKTRGANAAAWRIELLTVAKKAHRAHLQY